MAAASRAEARATLWTHRTLNVRPVGKKGTAMWLAPLVLASVVAQALPPQEQPTPPGETPSAIDQPKPIEELIVIAPPRQEEDPPVYDVLSGPVAREFEAQSALKAQKRRYRDTGLLSDYPGLRCAVFNRC